MDAVPRFTGPKSHGFRPSSPLFFRLTASGDGPISFYADKLPTGVQLDSKKGLLTGALSQPGRHRVRIEAVGANGRGERELTLVCGSRIGLTPPMGWNSWNCWGDSVNENHVLDSARALESTELSRHGWSYMNIDDAWQGDREKTGSHALRPNERFSNIAGLVEEIHGLGLRAGIYSTPWSESYAGYRGGSCDESSGQYFEPTEKGDWPLRLPHFHYGIHSFAKADARQFADWRFDYLKYDWFPNDIEHTREIASALQSSGRDIFLSLSNNLSPDSVHHLHPYAQSWRISGDIRDAWDLQNLTRGGYQGIRDLSRWQEQFYGLQKPGNWNDPDMLVIGRVGWGSELRPTRLNVEEQKTHFALWCLWSAPLLIGCPIDNLDETAKGLLTNDDLIDLNQDSLGAQARLLRTDAGRSIYIKPLDNGDIAIGLVNFSEEATDLECSWDEAARTGVQQVRDLFLGRDLGEFAKGIGAKVAAHGVAVYRVAAVN